MKISTIQTTLRSWVGLSGRHPDKEIRVRNAKVLCPNDDLDWALNYLYGFKNDKGLWKITSTCAMVTFSYLREVFEISNEYTGSPYKNHVGQIIEILRKTGFQYSCFESSRDDLCASLSIGDSVQIGDEGANGPIHWVNTVDYDPTSGVYSFVEGGAVDNSWIVERERIIISPGKDKKAYLVDANQPMKNGFPNGRLITAKLSVNKLAKKLGIELEND